MCMCICACACAHVRLWAGWCALQVCPLTWIRTADMACCSMVDVADCNDSVDCFSDCSLVLNRRAACKRAACNAAFLVAPSLDVASVWVQTAV